MTLPALTALVMLFGLLGLGIWVSLAMLGTGIVLLDLFRPMMPAAKILGQNLYNSGTAAELVSLPLFILMAEILFRTDVADRVLRGLTPWVARLPGGLLHINVLACTMFAAVSGSSAATTATVGRITLSQLLRRGYDRDLSIGGLAGAGTLGFLIPPSSIMIVYGVLSDTSILKLFIAGVIPGFGLAALFVAYLMLRDLLDPSVAPALAERYGWRARMRGLFDMLPVVCLMLAILGAMYLGFASPSEAAAVGVVGALLIALFGGTLTPATFFDALMGAVRTTSMIGLIIAGATFLSVVMTYLGIPIAIAQWIAGFSLSPFALVVVLMLFYLALGCVMDGMSAIVMTLPITLPLVLQAGYDPIWFGIFLILVVEMAQITPPVGFNLFVLQSISGENIWRIARMALPFLGLMIAMTLILTLWPGIATWLPAAMSKP